MKIKYILILILFTACTVTKKNIQSTTDYKTKIDSLNSVIKAKKVDSVIKYKDRIVTKEIKTVVEIPIECDENGKVKDLKYQVKSGKNKVSAIIKNGKIQIQSAIDSTKNILEKEYKTKLDSIYREIQSKSITNKEYTKETEKVKKQWSLLAHWKCGVIILILLGVIGLLLKKK